MVLFFLVVTGVIRAGEYADDKYLLPWTGPKLTLTTLETHIKKLDSIEGFLEWVAKDHPSQMESFTFIRKTTSLQSADGTSPRALVFGPDAKFIFTFNADGNRVEVIWLNDSTWEFREIQARNNASGPLALSEANPARCMQCHTTSLHPLWEDYRIWDGAYGRSDDVITRGTPEALEFEGFMKIREGHSRYKWLKYSKDSDVAPYGREDFGKNYALRPNLRLTNLLSRHQGKHLVKRMSQHPCFSKYQAKLLTELLCSYGHGFLDTMKELGIELEDYSLLLTSGRKEYYEGGVDLKDRVMKELYELTAKKDKELTTFVQNPSYNLIVEGNEEGGVDAQKDVCEHLLNKAKEAEALTCTPPKTPDTPLTIKMCASCHDVKNPKWREKVPERIAPGAEKFMPPVRRLSDRERREIEAYLQNELPKN